MTNTPQGNGDQYNPPSYGQGQTPGQQPYTTPTYGDQPAQPAYGEAPQANPYGQAPQANPYGQSPYGNDGVQPTGAWATPTSQYGYNQAPAPQYAGFGKRVLGWVFDYFIPGLIISPIASMLVPVRMNSTGYMEPRFDWATPLLSFLLYCALSAYSAKTGQTWGRQIAKTQLVGEDGRPVGFGRTLVRYIAHFVDSIILFIGWLFPLWDSKRQTIADKIMKTYVIDVSTTGPVNVQK